MLRTGAFLFTLLLVTALLSGCGYRRTTASADDLRAVGTVGSFTVTYDELYCLAMTYRSVLEAEYGEGIFDSEASRDRYREELTDLVYENITANYAVFELAKEIGYEESDVEDIVDEYLDEVVDSLGGMHAYRTMLHEAYMTDHLARRNYAATVLRGNVLQSYIYYLGLIEMDAEKICTEILESDGYLRTRHIAFFKDNGKSDAENRKALEGVLAELESGADFNDLVKKYGEDTAQTSDGYYFMKGEMQPAYEKAAFDLEIDETSGIVETEDGFYLIRRLEKQKEYVFLNCYGEGAPLYDAYQQYTFLSMVDEKQSELTFTPNGFGSSLDLTALGETAFFDGEYLLLLVGIGIALAAVVLLIVWWCVVSAKADRAERKHPTRHTHKKRRK